MSFSETIMGGDERFDKSPTAAWLTFVMLLGMTLAYVIGVPAFFHHRKFFPVSGRPLGLYVFMAVVIGAFLIRQYVYLLSPYPGIYCRWNTWVGTMCYNMTAATLLFQAWSIFFRKRIAIELENFGLHFLERIGRGKKASVKSSSEGVTSWYQSHRWLTSEGAFCLYVAFIILIIGMFEISLIATDRMARNTPFCSDSRATYWGLYLCLLQLCPFVVLGYKLGKMSHDNFGIKREVASIGWFCALCIVVWMGWAFTASRSASYCMSGDLFSQMCYVLVIFFCYLNPLHLALSARKALQPEKLSFKALMENKNGALTAAFLDFVSSELSAENFLYWQECEALAPVYSASLDAAELELADTELVGPGGTLTSLSNARAVGTMLDPLDVNTAALVDVNDVNSATSAAAEEETVALSSPSTSTNALPNTSPNTSPPSATSTVSMKLGTEAELELAPASRSNSNFSPASTPGAVQRTLGLPSKPATSSPSRVSSAQPVPSTADWPTVLTTAMSASRASSAQPTQSTQGSRRPSISENVPERESYTLDETEAELVRVQQLYLSPSGFRQVNVPSATLTSVVAVMGKLQAMARGDRKARLDKMRQAVILLRQAQDDVFKLMRDDSFPRFQQSLTADKIQALSEDFLRSKAGGKTSPQTMPPASGTRTPFFEKSVDASSQRPSPGHSRNHSPAHSRNASAIPSESRVGSPGHSRNASAVPSQSRGASPGHSRVTSMDYIASKTKPEPSYSKATSRDDLADLQFLADLTCPTPHREGDGEEEVEVLPPATGLLQNRSLRKSPSDSQSLDNKFPSESLVLSDNVEAAAQVAPESRIDVSSPRVPLVTGKERESNGSQSPVPEVA